VNRRIRTAWLRGLAIAGALSLSISAGTASASPARTTVGDAQAVFEAFGNAGWAILQHSPRYVDAAPAGGLSDGTVAIRPITGVGFDDKHYCSLDWHVIAVSYLDGGDHSYTMQDFVAVAAETSIDLVLDGGSMTTVRTASKPFLRDLSGSGLTTAYYFQEGAVVAPEALLVGAHSLEMHLVDPWGSYDDGITFFVDAPNTGACL
jgi:hypothetical protein